MLWLFQITSKSATDERSTESTFLQQQWAAAVTPQGLCDSQGRCSCQKSKRLFVKSRVRRLPWLGAHGHVWVFGKTTVTAIPDSPAPSASSSLSLSSGLGLWLCSLNSLGLKTEKCSGVHLVTLCPAPKREVGLQEAQEGS